MNGYSREIRAVSRSAARQSPLQGVWEEGIHTQVGSCPWGGKPDLAELWRPQVPARLLLMCETPECRGGDTSLSDEGTGGARGDSH